MQSLGIRSTGEEAPQLLDGPTPRPGNLGHAMHGLNLDLDCLDCRVSGNVRHQTTSGDERTSRQLTLNDLQVLKCWGRRQDEKRS